MNKIYRLVWSVVQDAWVVTGEFSQSHRKTKALCAAIILSSFSASAETIVITPNKPVEVTQGKSGVSGNDSNNNGNGEDGGTGLTVITQNGTTAQQNQLILNNSSNVDGGTGGDGGFGIIGNDSDGIGTHATDGTNGGNGGKGGAAISGNDFSLQNQARISGSDGGNGGTAAEGGSANPGNINGLLGFGNGGSGGIGGNAGDGGAGVNGRNIDINSDNIISGGNGGNGGQGGFGNFGSQHVNSRGGNGGNGGFAGNGGSGISGVNIVLHNKNTVKGGDGGNGGFGQNGEQGSTPNVNGTIGGNGGNATRGGSGGSALSGSKITIENDATGVISGGDGGIGGTGGAGGAGGTSNGSNGTTGIGGVGGNGVSGDQLNVKNNGLIGGGQGGEGGGGINAGSGGRGGKGGMGISGSNITLENAGAIAGGKGGIAGSKSNINNDGEYGAAIQFTSGNNTLILNTGSNITGDIVLSDANSTGNNLLIQNNASTTITGGLTAGTGTKITLTSGNVEFSAAATFADNTSLEFQRDGMLTADSASFENTSKLIMNITQWDQKAVTLLTTTNGITGYTGDAMVNNPLLTVGATDYAGINLTNGGKEMEYFLKWFSSSSDRFGTFDLREGALLTLNVDLANQNDNGAVWDGKTLTKAGLGTLVLAKESTYTGKTLVTGGVLKTGVVDAFADSSGVTVSKGAVLNLGGNSQSLAAGGIFDNRGTLLINDINAAVLTNPVVLKGDVNNSGTVVINNGSWHAGQTLQVQGNWQGSGGTVTLGTVLGGDNSKTDKLSIAGNVTGSTRVSVVNEGGRGARTLEGIKVIEVSGASDNTSFIQANRVVAGAYDYRLMKGNTSQTDKKNWFLTSSGLRPEAGSYTANLQAAGTLFNTRRSDRQGAGEYLDPVTGIRRETSLWLRSVGGHSQGNLSDGDSSFTANRVVLQLGGDVLSGTMTGQDAWHLGLMAGYGKQYSNTQNSQSGSGSKGEVWGYSTGLYGTWYQNAGTKTGLYTDSWLLYNWFDNSVKGDELSEEKYKSKGLTASLETGYRYHAGSYFSGEMENQIYVTPQAQVLWSGVKADNLTESNGTRIEGKGNNNLNTRLGVRLSVVGKSALDKGTARRFEPFVEANWLYTSKQYGTRMDGETITLNGARNVAELKAGVEGQITDNLSLWGSVSQNMGTDSYRDTQGVLGIKYGF